MDQLNNKINENWYLANIDETTVFMWGRMINSVHRGKLWITDSTYKSRAAILNSVHTMQVHIVCDLPVIYLESEFIHTYLL